MAGKKQYKYTLLKKDGSTEDLIIGKKKDFSYFRKVLNCSMIEHIPHAYYPDASGHAEFWGDEEGRYNIDNNRNPHFKVLRGNPYWGDKSDWDVVGDIIKEEVYKEVKVEAKGEDTNTNKRKAEKELFDMVYQWGRLGVVVDQHCFAFRKGLSEVRGEKMDIQSVGEILTERGIL